MSVKHIRLTESNKLRLHYEPHIQDSLQSALLNAPPAEGDEDGGYARSRLRELTEYGAWSS